MNYLQNRDITAGVFGTEGKTAAPAQTVIAAGQQGTLIELFTIMKDQMNQYLAKTPETATLSVVYDINEGTFGVMRDAKVHVLMDLGTDTLKNLDDQLTQLFSEDKKTGNPSQLFLLFFQVFAMMVYEVVLALMKDADTDELLEQVQTTVNHMVILLFLFTKPTKGDTACSWRSLFTQLYEKLRPGLNSENTTRGMMSEYLALMGKTVCPDKTLADKWSPQIVRANFTLKLFADAIMIKLGQGDARLGNNEDLTKLLAAAKFASETEARNTKEQGVYSFLNNTYVTPDELLPAVEEALSEMQSIQPKINFLREERSKRMGSAQVSKQTATDRNRPLEIREKAVVLGLTQYDEAKKCITALQAFEEREYVCHLTLMYFIRKNLSGDESEGYRAKHISLTKDYSDKPYTNLLKHMSAASTLLEYAKSSREQLEQVAKALRDKAFVMEVDDSDEFFKTIAEVTWIPRTDAWATQALTSNRSLPSRKPLVGGVGNKWDVSSMDSPGLRINHFLQNAYIRSERLYRSYPAQVFLQGGIEKMSNKNTPVFMALYRGSSLWVDFCRAACKDSLRRTDETSTFDHDHRQTYMTVLTYMNELSSVDTQQGFKDLIKDLSLMVEEDHIQPSLLRTVLFMNNKDDAAHNKRYVLQPIDSPFAELSFTPVHPYIQPPTPSNADKLLSETTKANQNNKQSMIVGPLSYIANDTRFSAKISNLLESMKDQVDALVSTPLIIMGYGSSGSGKTTALFGLNQFVPDRVVIGGLLEAIIKSLPVLTLPPAPVPFGQPPQAGVKAKCNYCVATVNEYYAYDILPNEQKKNIKYLLKMTGIETQKKYMKQYSDSNILAYLTILLTPETGLEISSKGLTEKQFEFTQQGDLWETLKLDASYVKRPVATLNLDTSMMTVLKDCVEEGSVYVSGRPRRVATTFMNPVSSRSHVIMTLDFSVRDLSLADPPAIASLQPLHIADFAGVENLPNCDVVGLQYSKAPRPLPNNTITRPYARKFIDIQTAQRQYTSMIGGAEADFTPLYQALEPINKIFTLTPVIPPIEFFPANDPKTSYAWNLFFLIHDQDAVMFQNGKSAYYAKYNLDPAFAISEPEAPSNMMLGEVIEAVIERSPDSSELSLVNKYHDFSSLKLKIAGVTLSTSPVKEANMAMVNSIKETMHALIVSKSVAGHGHGKFPLNDACCTWVHTQFTSSNTSANQRKYNIEVFKAILKWYKSQLGTLLGSNYDDDDDAHGSSICRFRIAEGTMINRSIRQVRDVFAAAYGQPLASANVTATIACVKQDARQCRMMNNPDYGVNVHNLKLVDTDASRRMPVAEKVLSIVEKKPSGSKTPQANAIILGVFNTNSKRDSPPYLDYIPCSALIQEYKRMSGSPLMSACEYENPANHDKLIDSLAPNTAVLDQYSLDLKAAIERASYEERDCSDLKAEELLIQKIRLTDNPTRIQDIEKVIANRTQLNSNTAVGTLEFLDQACKIFSTNQTFVLP